MTSDASGRAGRMRAELASWSAPPEQRALHDSFLTHLAAHPDGWSRQCHPDHLTASALVLTRSGTHVLLGLHGKVGRWLQFGGHIEAADTSLGAAALRETREESGLADVHLVQETPVRLDRHAAPCGARHHLDVQYLAAVDELLPPRASAESRRVEWFPVDDLPTDCDESVRQLVADAMAVLHLNEPGELD